MPIKRLPNRHPRLRLSSLSPNITILVKMIKKWEASIQIHVIKKKAQNIDFHHLVAVLVGLLSNKT